MQQNNEQQAQQQQQQPHKQFSERDRLLPKGEFTTERQLLQQSALDAYKSKY